MSLIEHLNSLAPGAFIRMNTLYTCIAGLYHELKSTIYFKFSEVKPYIVNDRLFSEPIKRDMFAQYDYDENDRTRGKKEKEPTYDEPRFVRFV